MLQFPRWRVDVTVGGDLVKTFYETATTSAAAIAKAKHKMRGAVSNAGAFKFKAAKDAGEAKSRHAAKKKSPAQLDADIAEAMSGTVKCPSPDHPLYPELRRIRQVAHDTSWAASQLAQDAERAFRNGDCAKAAEMLEAAKGVIAKERRRKRR